MVRTVPARKWRSEDIIDAKENLAYRQTFSALRELRHVGLTEKNGNFPKDVMLEDDLFSVS